jgi:hypothetical protein
LALNRSSAAHIIRCLQEYGELWSHMPSAGSRFMKSQKQHRYVSRRGPFAQPPDPAVARALDIAENEGWPASATRVGMPLAVRRASSACSIPIAFLR